MDESKLIAALIEQAESNRDLADAIRLQTLGLHALADAIAAPVEGEPDAPQDGDAERYMDGRLVGDH